MVTSALANNAVLVVDDEEVIRRVLDLSLRCSGMTACLAHSGEEALQLYRDHAAAIAVVLLDVRMPGLDGVQTLEALKQLNPAVRCCFMSGNFGDYAKEDLLKRGALAIFEKPFRVEQVVQALSRLAS
jgi:two-component system response regulator AtoC